MLLHHATGHSRAITQGAASDHRALAPGDEQQEPTKTLYALRRQTVEPVFGIIKSAMGFTRFHLRGLANVATEWTLVALAYNCRRITRLSAA
ncbi:transposase [Acidomonas methanolica]|nr:transposase [Acidomonas methanolica]GBQ45822.1 transposase [Acidomonas methanolica]GEL00395.1 hypothetical protein AME01nite_28930 [Acidomonas methanolica NBRC 104435]